VHGLSPTEIAHALGCPVATVKTRLQRGLDWLRRLLPSGIAVGLAGMLTTGRGLAAVRGAVLAKVKPLVPMAAASVAIGVIGAGIVMKKLVFGACVILCIAALWMAVPRPDEAVNSGGTVAGPSSTEQATMPVAAPTQTASNEPAAGERVAVPASIAATGSAALEFVWKGYDTPAANLWVYWYSMAPGSSPSSSLSADAQGRLRLADLRAGEYRFSGNRFSQLLAIRAGGETKARIEVEPRLHVDGVVVDGDGRPVAGAAVYVQYFADPEDREPRAVAVTRDDGAFGGATDHGGYFWAQKGGFAPSPCQHEQVEGKLQLRLVLGSGGTVLRGTVRTSERGPAADARVTIVRTLPRDQCSAPIVLRTDARGAFVTTELGAGEHLLVAQAAGHAATPVEFTVTAGQAQSLEVQLARGATVFGSVHDSDGKPIRVAFAARPAWAGSPSAWVEALRPLHHLCVVRAHGNADGSYRIDNVPAAMVTVATSAIGVAVDQTRELQLQEGTSQRCDFVLGCGGEIHGRVVDTSDQPQAHWDVQFSPLSGGTGHMISTDAQGLFSQAGLDGAEYSVTAKPMGISTHLPWAAATNVRPGTGEVVLRAKHTRDDEGWFTGTILDASGAPARGASGWVTPVGQVQGSHCQLTVDEAGRFEIGPLPPGSYHVGVRIPTEGSINLGLHDLQPRSKLDLGTARLPPAGTLELRFSTPDGRTVAPAEVSAWDKAGNGGAVFERGADGIFRSKPVPAGIYRVLAWGEDFVRLDQQVVVTADRATLTELTVTPATPVRFTLPHHAGAVGSEVQLRILDAAGKVVASPTLSIDNATGFTWSRGLPRGNYSFEANAWPDGEPVRGTFVVSGDSAVQRVEVKLPAKRS